MQSTKLADGTEVFCLRSAEAQVLDYHINGYLHKSIKIKDGDVLFDIGANIGVLGVRMMQLYPNATLYAFEPILPIFEVLKANAQRYAAVQAALDQLDERSRTVIELRFFERLGQEEIAERLGVSRPAVSEMTRRMETEGLIEIDRTIRLTDSGSVLAERVVRRHRLAERLLTDILGLSWADAHTEAGRWEHVISDAVEAAISTSFQGEILRTWPYSYGRITPRLWTVGLNITIGGTGALSRRS